MELQTKEFLTDRDIDALLAVVANLTAEVVDLQQRIARLEGDDTASEAAATQNRVDGLVNRVFSPLRDDPTLP